MDCILYPCYFPNIVHFTAMYQSNTIYFEVCDNYQKQTYRNRTEIYGTNGKLSLTIPVIYSQRNRQAYKDVKVFNNENWQQQHLKSLKAAYNTSPFFEFYIDDLMPLFSRKFDYLLDLNLVGFEILEDLLQLNLDVTKTERFEKKIEGIEDYRHLANPKNTKVDFEAYTQVFTDKHGFLSNLSILDLLFNEGPATEMYLSRQKPIS